jgi:hypothetical protein
MSYDINPLGTTMHLRELDRQAARSRDLPTERAQSAANDRSANSNVVKSGAGWSVARAGRALEECLSASTTALKRLILLSAS